MSTSLLSAPKAGDSFKFLPWLSVLAENWGKAGSLNLFYLWFLWFLTSLVILEKKNFSDWPPRTFFTLASLHVSLTEKGELKQESRTYNWTPRKKTADLKMTKEHFSKEIQMVNMHRKRCSISPTTRETLIKTTMIHHHPVIRMVMRKKKKRQNNQCWQGCRKIETSVFCCLWGTCYGKEYRGPQHIKNRITMWCSNSTSGYVCKQLKADICTPTFIAALFIRAKRQKLLKCFQMDG